MEINEMIDSIVDGIKLVSKDDDNSRTLQKSLVKSMRAIEIGMNDVDYEPSSDEEDSVTELKSAIKLITGEDDELAAELNDSNDEDDVEEEEDEIVEDEDEDIDEDEIDIDDDDDEDVEYDDEIVEEEEDNDNDEDDLDDREDSLDDGDVDDSPDKDT